MVQSIGRTILLLAGAATLELSIPLHVGAQDASPIGRYVREWLAAAGVEVDSARLVDRRIRGETEITIVRVEGRTAWGEYLTLRRTLTGIDSLTLLGTLPGHWDPVSIEAIFDRELYVRKIGGYNIARFQRYRMLDDGSVDEAELAPPIPGPISIVGDSVYGAWSFGDEGQIVLVLSMRDREPVAYHVASDHAIEAFEARADGVAVVTKERVMTRSGAGWSGRRRNVVPAEPVPPLLHPALPQFRIVPDGIAELRLRDTLFIPLNFPDFELFRRLRPEHLPGISADDITLDVAIGPVTDDGRRVWFGLQFYDGEGLDGVGGIGWLDPETREAEIAYPPGMADYSVSAIRVIDGKVLVGLHIQPEGATIHAGLGRYDPETGDFEHILENGYISAIASHGDRLFAVATEGLIELVGPKRTLTRWQVYPPGSTGGPPPIVKWDGMINADSERSGE